MKEQSKEEDNIYLYSEGQEEEAEYSQMNEEESFQEYNLEDDDRMGDSSAGTDESDLDNSPLNYSQAHKYEEESNESEAVNQEKAKPHNVSVFGSLLKTLINPVEGWKSVRRHKISPEVAQRECFNPLLAVLAVSKFAQLAYSSSITVSDVLVDAVISFVSFFFGYFCILIVLKMVMPKNVSSLFDTDFGKIFVIFGLSSLCLFMTLIELLPMLWAVLIFLPLWTVYIICRGVKFFKFPDQHQILNTALLNLIIIGVPMAISWGLGIILPK